MKQATLDAFVESQLKALGVTPVVTTDEQIYDAMLQCCRKTKKAASPEQIGSGMKRTTVASSLKRLIESGRVLRLSRGKYIPVVKP